MFSGCLFCHDFVGDLDRNLAITAKHFSSAHFSFVCSWLCVVARVAIRVIRVIKIVGLQ